MIWFHTSVSDQSVAFLHVLHRTFGLRLQFESLISAKDNVDYCNTVLAGAPRTVTDKLQRVLNAAARVITGTRKFDRCLGQILHDQLHWLDVPDRVLFKLAVTGCLNGRAPPYLSEHCIPVSSADTRRHLRSANRHLLAVPRFRLNSYGRRAFSVAGPMACYSLPDFIRVPTSSTNCFRRSPKTYLLRALLVHPAHSGSQRLCATQIHTLTHSLTHSPGVLILTAT